MHTAFSAVLARAGDTRSKRDVVDARIVIEVKSGAGSMIHSPVQVGGYPKLVSGAAPDDTDHDGMPDADQDGYTNLEEYLHSLME